MAKVKIDDQILTDIAYAIREKNSEVSTVGISTSDMAARIEEITVADEASAGKGPYYMVDSIEEMDNITDANENDVCIVCTNEIVKFDEDHRMVTKIYFPDAIVLGGELDPMDMFNGEGQDTVNSNIVAMFDLTGRNFRFETLVDNPGGGSTGTTRVQYNSDDGITFTRAEGYNTKDGFVPYVTEWIFDNPVRLSLDNGWYDFDTIYEFVRSDRVAITGTYLYSNGKWSEIPAKVIE